MSDDWRGDTGVSAYNEAAVSNLGSPHPICIGMADDLVAEFMASWEKSSEVSALKMIQLGWGSLRSVTLVIRMGMTPQAPVIQRLALESIIYGLLFRFDPEFHLLWKQRHNDPKALSKFRRHGFKRAMEIIYEKSGPLHAKTEQIYQALIDIGAHPNVLGIDQISEYQIQDTEALGSARFYQLRGQPFVDMAHLNTALIYQILLDSIILIWPERSKKKQLDTRRTQVAVSIVNFLELVREAHEQIEKR